MESTTEFTGLTMPVFTAFSWTGEEAAINFALTQLEAFIGRLHAQLPRDVQALFPHYGLDRESQTVYLAMSEPVEEDAHIVFHVRPASLEIMLVISHKKAVAKALKIAESDQERWTTLLAELEPDWQLRLQQMEYDEETETATHYQDIYKDSLENLDAETATVSLLKAAFLSGESQWVTPLYLSRRRDAEQVAAMGLSVVENMADDVRALAPLVRFLTSQKPAAKAKPAKKAAPKTDAPADAAPAEEPPADEPEIEPVDQFTYVSRLKPLHIRRGFINLTKKHWPFFAVSARTETRPVTIFYEGQTDEKSSVWRLVPDDQARVVLSPVVRSWLEENFDPEDEIQVTAVKLDEDEIQLSLAAIDE